MIRFTVKGNFDRTFKFLKKMEKRDHVIFVLEINIIKKLFGLFQFQLNMRNTKKYMNIKNKSNIEYTILFLVK